MRWLLYNLLFALAFIATFPHFLLRMRKRGGYAAHFRQRFGRYAPELESRLRPGALWLHAVSVGEVQMLAYSLCAAFAALAGVVNASRIQIGDPEAGATYELDAIAAVVIGGTSLSGGRGGMLLTLIGTLIIAYINKILSINNVGEAYRLLAKGLIIVAAVLIQQRKKA